MARRLPEQTLVRGHGPLGGEGVRTAHQAGIETVILPARNRKDFDDIPAHAREGLRFVWVSEVTEVLGEALGLDTQTDSGQGRGVDPDRRLSAAPDSSD